MLVPGAGLVVQGRLRWAIYMQLVLISIVVMICWTRLVFEPLAIQVSIGLIILVYLASLLLCFKVKTVTSESRPKTAIQVVGFIAIGLTVWSAGIVYKQQWLGFEVYFVPSNSMSPTLREGDFVIGDTWLYDRVAPQTNEIVIFKQNEYLYIKRVFAIEGEYVFQRGVNVSKNDTQVSSTTVSIEPGEVFVVGDNRPESRDSRHFGPIATSTVTAKIKIKIFSIKNQSINLEDFGRETI